MSVRRHRAGASAGQTPRGRAPSRGQTRRGPAVRFVTAVACAAALALVPRAPRADEAATDPAPERHWRLSTLTFGFADDFLGF
ncbi:MAG: hypothetical protein ACJ79R_04815, partial [Anaeromyxobacteraceae bacterium]